MSDTPDTTPTHLSIRDEPELMDRAVLLVDDNPSTHFAVASTLTDGGAEVTFAYDGEEAAFRCAVQLEASRPFDLIVVALDPSGCAAVCRRLRASGYRGPMLALGRFDDPRRATDAGADAVVADASDREGLYAAAVELVGRPRVCDVRTRDTAAVVSDLSPFPQMHAMLERFVDELPQRLSAMAGAAAERDLEHLGALVRQLKQSAGSHGFIDISREAAETERQLQATDDLQDALYELAEVCRRAAVATETGPVLPPSA